jgi:hypothetical protein
MNLGQRCLFILFVLTLSLVTPYLRGDGIAYYAYIASLVIDHDLYFEDEYRHADPLHYHNYFDAQDRLKPHLYTQTGYVRNMASIGPSLLWAPFFLTAHIFTALYNVLPFPHAPIPQDGFSLPYRYLCALSTALYGFLGLLLAFSVARQLFDDRVAFWATLGIWFASGLPVYMYFLPFMSHAHSVFTCSLLVWFWWRTYDQRVAADDLTTFRLRSWFLLGLLSALAFITYYPNLLLSLFVLADFVELTYRARQHSWRFAGLFVAVPMALWAFGFFLGWLPLGLIKWVIYGSPFQLGYGEPWWFFDPRLWQVLFSSEHGLFSWTPIILLACVGFVPLIHRQPNLGWRCLLTFLTFWYLIASYDDWHGQSSFSNRFFLSLTPLFVLGLAALLAAVRERFKEAAFRFALVFIALLILWNFGFIFQWGTGLINKRGPISWTKMIRQQLTVVPKELPRTAYRLFTDRHGLLKEIERRDMEEARHYRIRR